MTQDSGVYVLFNGHEPLYVGSSIRMKQRVAGHAHRGKFNRVEYHPFDVSVLEDKEQQFIDSLKPSLNKRKAFRPSLNIPLECARKFVIDFTTDDMKIIATLQKRMIATQGKVSIAAVIRAAIRTAAAREAK